MKKENVMMRVGKLTMIAAVMCAVVLTACDNDDNNDPDQVSDADRTFMNRASQGNRAEIELGQLAMQRGSHEAIREFGSMIVEDHQEAQNELESIARDRNVDNLETNLTQEQQAMRDMLNNLSGFAFDSAYIHGQVKMHNQTDSLYQAHLNVSQEVRIRQYINRYIDVVRMHRDHADSLANALAPVDSDTVTIGE
jgi:putative membrane protein